MSFFYYPVAKLAATQCEILSVGHRAIKNTYASACEPKLDRTAIGPAPFEMYEEVKDL